MAKAEHIAKLKEGAAAWNEYQAARQLLERLEKGRQNTASGAGRKNLDRQLKQQREIVRRLQ